MQEIRCPNCGEVFQVDETGYNQIVKQVRDKEFAKELEHREKELEAKQRQELELIRLQEEKVRTASITKKDAVFDETKLEWMNGQYIKEMSAGDWSFKPSWKPVKRRKILLCLKPWRRKIRNFQWRQGNTPKA